MGLVIGLECGTGRCHRSSFGRAGLGRSGAGAVGVKPSWNSRCPHGVDTALEVIGATGVVLDADNRVLRAAKSAISLGLVTDRDVVYQPILDLVRESREEGIPLSERV